MRHRAIALSALMLCMFGACDQDPFGLSERKVVGPYSLNQFENGAYYLVGGGGSDPSGLLRGAVLQMGWTDRMILVKRKASVGDGEDWILVDVALRRVIGPIDSAALATRPELSAIEMMAADSAWRRLR